MIADCVKIHAYEKYFAPFQRNKRKTLKIFFQSFFRSILECILKNLLLLDRHGDGDGLMDIECH